jgi:predicted transposase YdaD
VDTDRPIKVLFERQGQSLLPFIGERDPRARVTAVQPVELPVPSRTADCVLRLEAEGAVWYRHVEFQSGPDPDMPRRCFEYASRLVLHYDAPVLTTVMYLLPGADRGAVDAFRVTLGDRVVNEWRFEIVRLWELDVSVAFSSGEPGPLALVPLLRGGDEPENLREAARALGAMPRAVAADARSVLIDLAGQRYDRATLLNVLGKDCAMQSWLWQMGADEGRAEGRAEGQLKGRVLAGRQICADLAKELHPRVAGRALPVIEACEDPETLRAWTLQCPKLSDGEFVTLVTGKPAARPSRSRASRPSRRARPSKRR